MTLHQLAHGTDCQGMEHLWQREAQTVVENCGNTPILRCSRSEGGDTACFASELIGDREVRAERSRGRHTPSILSKGGLSTSEEVTFRRVRESAVMASEIKQLPDLAGFLKLASQPAWLRVSAAIKNSSQEIGRTQGSMTRTEVQ